jgi:DNA mismatch repair protein MutS
VHVAQLAGLPKSVIHRAHEVLADLEAGGPKKKVTSTKKSGNPPVPQLTLFGEKSPVLEELAKLDINTLTPLEALTKLYELQKKAGEG